MRPTPTLLQLAVCLTSFAPLASAWPGWLPEVDSLVVRQNDNGDGPTTTDGASSDRTNERDSTITDGPTESDIPSGEELQGNQTKDLNTAGLDDSDSKATKGGSKTTKGKSKQTIDPAGQAGGVKMLTPDPTFTPTPLYKIGDNVTWGWNFTSVQAEPTAIDVILSCSAASATYTLAGNVSYQSAIPTFVWDSREQEKDVEAPLMNALYTLIIKDSNAEITDTPKAGYLGSWQGFVFGLYYPKPYVPLSEWECTGCNSATGGLDTQAIKLAAAMSVVTVLSFTWFTAGLGLN